MCGLMGFALGLVRSNWCFDDLEGILFIYYHSINRKYAVCILLDFFHKRNCTYIIKILIFLI